MKKIEMEGMKFGHLIVIKEIEKLNHNHKYWLCKCDCGNETIVEGWNLRSGHTQTCGKCEKYELIDNNTMKCILPNGDTFIFDTKDFDLIKKHKWSLEDTGYVHTTINYHTVRLHRYLMNPNKGVYIDHINGIRNDNRRTNLRFATNQQNSSNQRLNKRNSTRYKGVYIDKRRHTYEATITKNYKSIYLGAFSNPIEAAISYDKAAIALFGEYAKTNFERRHYG